MTRSFDLVIVGSGFSSSLLAMIARRCGRSVLMVERGHHPRFAIGESSSPIANLLLESIARRWDLPRLLPFCTWGGWRRERSDVGVGLKRGFSFYRHEAGLPFTPSADRSNQLLVAASPNDEVADTHWYRPDFDHWLAREAVALGAELREGAAARLLTTGAMTELEVSTEDGRLETIGANVLVDASGPRGFLYRQLGLAEQPLPGLPPTCHLYAHFAGVERFASLADPGDGRQPPYPPDAAALHHLFDGGWMWVLRFDGGITSAGVSMTEAAADELGLEQRDPAWRRLLDRLPSVAKQFRSSTLTTDWYFARRPSFRAARAVGDGWAMLPSAAGFVDPLLSTGFPLTLFGVIRLGTALEAGWNSADLAAYEAMTFDEVESASRLVGALFSRLDRFPDFVALSKLYFAAASFSEAASRLDSPLRSQRFLLRDRGDFVAGFDAICSRATGTPATGYPELAADVAAAIAPIDVAGLGDRARAHWFGVLADDLRRGQSKLAVAPERIETLLAEAGMAETPAGFPAPPA